MTTELLGVRGRGILDGHPVSNAQGSNDTQIIRRGGIADIHAAGSVVIARPQIVSIANGECSPQVQDTGGAVAMLDYPVRILAFILRWPAHDNCATPSESGARNAGMQYCGVSASKCGRSNSRTQAQRSGDYVRFGTSDWTACCAAVWYLEAREDWVGRSIGRGVAGTGGEMHTPAGGAAPPNTRIFAFHSQSTTMISSPDSPCAARGLCTPSNNNMPGLSAGKSEGLIVNGAVLASRRASSFKLQSLQLLLGLVMAPIRRVGCLGAARQAPMSPSHLRRVHSLSLGASVGER